MLQNGENCTEREYQSKENQNTLEMPWTETVKAAAAAAAAAGKLLACYEDPKKEDCGRLLASLHGQKQKLNQE